MDLGTALQVLQALAPQLFTNSNKPATNESTAMTPPRWSRRYLGADYHAALVKLAARLVGQGTSRPGAISILQGLMESSTGPHDGRWAARYADIPPRGAVGGRQVWTNREIRNRAAPRAYGRCAHGQDI